jgi:hypothetical protein
VATRLATASPTTPLASRALAIAPAHDHDTSGSSWPRAMLGVLYPTKEPPREGEVLKGELKAEGIGSSERGSLDDGGSGNCHHMWHSWDIRKSGAGSPVLEI